MAPEPILPEPSVLTGSVPPPDAECTAEPGAPPDEFGVLSPPSADLGASVDGGPSGRLAGCSGGRRSGRSGGRSLSAGRAGALWPLRLPGRKPPKFVRGSGVTVHGQIEQWLADAIVTGQLAPGDRLPTEQDLAAWLGVSRMTLRHALAELAQRGLVTRTVGRSGGTFVAEPKVEQDLTVLAGFSEQLRRNGLVAGARVLAAVQTAASPAASAALEIAAGEPVYEVRRLRLAGGEPILIEDSLLPARRCPGLLGFRLDGSIYELLEQKYGQRPVRAKEVLEPIAAGVREAEALGVAEGAPLMLVERITYSQSGLPLEFARDLFRGDRTRVVVWTSELARDI